MDSDQVEQLLARDADMRALARRLVLDPDDADDVAQDAWLVAARRQERPDLAAFGWLARVVRNLSRHLPRAESRRTRRETASAHPEASPSTAEVVERAEVRRRLIEAVLALEEPFRTTVLLRWFEDEPPRRIAARFGVPVETVRSRLKRALALLREKLDRDHGATRASWLVPLASVAGIRIPAATAVVAVASSSPIVGTIAVGAVVMKAKWALACVGVLLLAGSGWFLWQRGSEEAPEGSGASWSSLARKPLEFDRIGENTAVSAPANAASRGIEGRRFVEPPEPPPAKVGSAILKLIWESDRKPIPNLRVWVHTWPSPAVELMTDQEGICRSDRIPCGRALVSTIFTGSKWVDVSADKTAEETIEIPEGAKITGQVVGQKGAPVGGAEIWISGDQALYHGEVVTKSLPDGSFKIRGIQFDSRRFVGARAPGYAPSQLSPCHWYSSEVLLHLVLRASPGNLRGRVTGPDGAPVRDAAVHIGGAGFHEELRYDDFGMKLPTFRTATDADGAFTFEGLPAGEMALLVRGERCAPWFGSVAIRSDETSVVGVPLVEGAILSGDVVDEAGKPLAGISVSRRPYTWFLAAAWSDEAGHFRLDRLPAGTMDIVAGGKDELGTASKTVELASGVETKVRLQFTRGLAISGRVVNERGGPIKACRVTIDGSAGKESDYRTVTTSIDGSFAFAKCLDAHYHLRVYEPDARIDSIRLENVRPRSEPLVLKIPDQNRAASFIKGRIVDADGVPCPDATVTVWFKGSGPNHPVGPDGAFSAGPIPAGQDYKMTISFPGLRYQVYEKEIMLGVGETRNLGDIKLLNRLKLKLERDDGKPVDQLTIDLAFHGGIGSVKMHAKDGVAVSQPLPPGSHELSISSPDVMQVRMPVEIQADQETTLDLKLRSGKKYQLEFVDEPGATPTANVLIQIKQSGKVVTEMRLGRYKSFPLRYEFVLADGTYEIEGTSDAGRRASATITVPDAAGDSPRPLVFTLK